jgi:hypothetical protein
MYPILYLSILLHAILNSLCISESVSNATNYFFLPLSLGTQHVSALDGHLQVSQYMDYSVCDFNAHWCSVTVSTYWDTWRWPSRAETCCVLSESGRKKIICCITGRLWYTYAVEHVSISTGHCCNRFMYLKYEQYLKEFLICFAANYIFKNAVFWDVSPCRSCVNRCFEGTYRFHLQGRKIRERGTNVSSWHSSQSPPWKLLILHNYIFLRILSFALFLITQTTPFGCFARLSHEVRTSSSPSGVSLVFVVLKIVYTDLVTIR